MLLFCCLRIETPSEKFFFCVVITRGFLELFRYFRSPWSKRNVHAMSHRIAPLCKAMRWSEFLSFFFLSFSYAMLKYDSRVYCVGRHFCCRFCLSMLNSCNNIKTTKKKLRISQMCFMLS